LLQAIAACSGFLLTFGDCFAYEHPHLPGEVLITLDADCLATDPPVVLHPIAAGVARSALPTGLHDDHPRHPVRHH
jgi:hypothetical protein